MRLEEGVPAASVPEAIVTTAGPTPRRVPVTVWIAGAFVFLAVVCALFGRQIAPYPPNVQNLLLGATPPGGEHLAGTDLLGRDVFSRTIVGARTALLGPTIVAVGAFAIATVLGLLSGYLGGVIDSIVMRWVDFMFALPGPLIAIVIVGVAGGGFWTAVVVLVVLFTAPDTRIVRSAVLEQRPLPYIEAARTLGISRWRIMFLHILPNILPIVAAYVVLDFAFALVSLAGLSFLGLGVSPGQADWGRMLFENRTLLLTNPMAAILPGAAIVVTAGGINIIGDWIYQRMASR
ncbi:MAG TPA: ABC transporter permease [Actinomycetota bacterium]|nr:ABC transporter permease [Actinomycetota bacterium]